MVTVLLVRYGGERHYFFGEFRFVKVFEIRTGRFESTQKCDALGGDGVDRIAGDTIVACMWLT